MRLGVAMRSMGPQSEPDVFLACARAAEEAGLDDLWIQDHVAIPPDDAEGSGGRYLDPLTALAWLAAHTRRIGLGTGVLILPYRPALPTAKAIATVQELSGGRLLLGVGVGWMKPEFRALGVPRERRGALTDEVLDFLERCFADDVVEAHGQPFLFRPRPPKPPVFVGGAPPHALERAARHADGWLPMALSPEQLAEPVATLRALARDAGRPAPQVVLMTGLPLDDPARAADAACAFREAGVTGLVHGSRYADADSFRRTAETLALHVRPALASGSAGAS
jgi:probable F420-dependent oxidoreductase